MGRQLSHQRGKNGLSAGELLAAGGGTPALGGHHGGNWGGAVRFVRGGSGHGNCSRGGSSCGDSSQGNSGHGGLQEHSAGTRLAEHCVQGVDAGSVVQKVDRSGGGSASHMRGRGSCVRRRGHQ